MSTEFAISPDDFRRYIESYGGFGDARQVAMLAMQKLGGKPVVFPNSIPEAGKFNIYQNFVDLRNTSAVDRSFNRVKQVNSQSQVETISLIASRMMATFGWQLSQDQLGAVQAAAEILGKYGPQYIGIAKRVLQAGGLDDESQGGSMQTLNLALGVAENILDATYGPAGSRLPFYGAAKESISGLVDIGSQDAILDEVMQRMFPVDVDVSKFGGLKAREVGDVVSHLSHLGINPLNTQAATTKALIRENAVSEYNFQQTSARGGTPISGLTTLTYPEQSRLIDSLVDKRKQDIFNKGTRLETKKEWVKNQENLLRQKSDTGDIASNLVVDYVNQIENVTSLSRRLNSYGIAKDVNLATATQEQLGDVSYALTNLETTYLDQKRNTPQANEEQLRELDTKIQSLQTLRNQFNTYRTAVEQYTKAGGTAVSDFNDMIQTNQKRRMTEAINASATLKDFFATHADYQDKYIEARIKREELGRVKEVQDLMPKLESNNEEERKDALNELITTPNIRPEIKENLIALYGTPTYVYNDKTYNLNDWEKAVSKDMDIVLQQDARQDVTSIIGEYGRLLATGDQKRIEDFRDKNKEVISRYEAVMASRQTEDLAGAEARSLARMQNAINATGGASINGKPIQGIGDVENIMDMMTQITGRYQMGDTDWENYWSLISYGMTQTGTNADTLLQVSKHAAEAAIQRGGNRGTAAMAATQLALASNTALRNAGLNIQQGNTLIAQAAGVGSNNRLARTVNAMIWAMRENDIDESKLDDKQKAILNKIRRRTALSVEETDYLNKQGTTMLRAMGVKPEDLRGLMSMDMYGESGLYATTAGALYELNNKTHQNIRFTDIGKRLVNELGLKANTARTISDLAYDVITENKDAYDNADKFKEALTAKMQEAGVPKEIIKQVVNGMNPERLLRFTRKALGDTANYSFNGNVQAAKGAYQAQKNADKQLSQLQRVSRASQALPEVSNNITNNIMEALRRPGSNWGDIISAGFGKNLNNEERVRWSSAISTMALMSENKDLFQDITTKEFDTAKDALNEILNKENVTEKALTETLSERDYLLSKFKRNNVSPKEIEEYLKSTGADKQAKWEALQKKGVTTADITAWRNNSANYNYMMKGLKAEQVSALTNTLRSGALSAKETIEQRSQLEETPVSLTDQPEQQGVPQNPPASSVPPSGGAGTPSGEPRESVPAPPAPPQAPPATASPQDQASYTPGPLELDENGNVIERGRTARRTGQSVGDAICVYVVNPENSNLTLPTTPAAAGTRPS